MNKFAWLLVLWLVLTPKCNQAQLSHSYSLPDIRFEQEKYLSVIKTFTESDTNFTVNEKIICIATTPKFTEQEFSTEATEDSLHQYNYLVYLNTTPTGAIEERLWLYDNVDFRLQTIDLSYIPRYCLVVLKDSVGKVLWLQDYLAVDPWRWSYAITDDTTDIVKLLRAELKRDDIKTVDLAAVAPRKINFMVTLAGEPVDSASQALLMRLSADGWELKIYYGNFGGQFMINTLIIKADKLALIGKLKLSRIYNLSFTKSLNNSENILRPSSELDTFDIFGNNVCRDDMSQVLTSCEKVDYYTPFALSDTDSVVQYSFDLRYLGYSGILNKIFICQAVPRIKIDNTWPYALYANGDVVEMLSPAKVKEFLLGIADVESWFSYKLSEVVKCIYITSDRIINAGYFSSDRHSVFVYGLTLSKLDPAYFIPVDARVVGRHEALHAVGDKLGLNKNKLLKRLFDDLNANYRVNYTGGPGYFFASLDERRFDPDSTIFGGHSYESVEEFVASFLNSIIRDNWEEIISKKSYEFRQNYSHVIQVFKNIFLRQESLASTPMAKLLEARLVWLRENE